MAFFESLFVPSSKPKAPKVAAPVVDQGPIQMAAADARKRAMMAKGRGSTDIVSQGAGGGQGLGVVGG